MLVYQCKACNQPIVFIKTKAGKKMPCDWQQVAYAQRDDGPDTIITPNGETVRGTVQKQADGHSTGLGYKPHWASCKGADTFRRKAGQK